MITAPCLTYQRSRGAYTSSFLAKALPLTFFRPRVFGPCASGSQAFAAARLRPTPSCCRRTGTSPQTLAAGALGSLYQLQRSRTRSRFWACALVQEPPPLGTRRCSARPFPSRKTFLGAWLTGRGCWRRNQGFAGKDAVPLSDVTWSSFSNFVVPREHEAQPPDNSSFQYLVCFFAGAVKLRVPLNRASEQVMQANPRNADRVFQDVDPLLSVEGSHAFQGFQRRGCCYSAASLRKCTWPFLWTDAYKPPIRLA